MKGSFASALTMFFTVILGLVVLSLVINGQSNKDRSQKLVLETEEYTLQKAMEAAKLYVHTSLKYSFYQACYDISKKGGALPDAESFKGSIEAETLKQLNLYTASHYHFFENLDVRLPVYSSVSIEDLGDGNISINASSQEMMSIQRELDRKNVTLMKDGNVSIVVSSPCLRLLESARESSKETSGSLSGVEHELNKWPTEFSIEMDHPYKHDHNDAFFSVINADYYQLLRDEPFSETAAIKDAQAIIASQIELPSDSLDDGTVVDNKGTSLDVKITLSCTGYTFEEEGVERSHKDCEVSYKVTVSMVTGVMESGQLKYPVFNGEAISYEPIKFMVTENRVFERPEKATTS